MEIRILGSLEIIVEGRRLDLGSPRQQTVLAVLLLEAGRVVSVRRLMEAIYDDDPPATSRAQIQICISALRRLFGAYGYPGIITTESQGYIFHCDDQQVDAQRFRRLAAEARVARDEGQLDDAVHKYREALALCTEPLEGIESRLVRSAVTRFAEWQITINEDCIELELQLGRHRELVAEITELVERHPLRERLRGQLMTALYRSGRQAEALQVYQHTRETMIEQLGLEPNEGLRQLHQAILTSDESLNAPPPPPPVRGSPPPVPLGMPRLLPSDIADFTGRGQQVELIRRLLTSDRSQLAVPVVAISGKPGVGKTALAVHTSHLIADQFPDGQLFADLHGAASPTIHPKQVLERFLRALGMPGTEIPDGLEERAEVYRTMLSSRRMLIVLDDVGTESQVLPLVPGYPGCAVIVTSRSRLVGLPGAMPVEIKTFDSQQSINLLKRIAGSARIQAGPEPAAALAQLCGHLPLALRIAGARLAARPNWTIDHLVERLADEARRLDELRYGEMGIRASLALTYESMSEPARRLLRRLAILDFTHYSGWTAAALLDVPLSAAEDLLDDLSDAQLIEISDTEDGQARYHLHELTRVFARERVAAEESPAERKDEITRVLSALLTLAQQAHSLEYGGDYVQVHSAAPRWPATPEQMETIIGIPMQWFERERTTLVSAIRQAARAGLVELCWDLALTSVTLFEARIYYDDWRLTHEVALEAARQAGDVRGQAAMLYSLGSLLSAEQRFHDARRCFESAAEMFQAEGNSQGEALAIRDLAFLDRMYGRLSTAEAGYRRALKIFHATEDLAAAAFVLHSLARTRLESGDPEEAKRLLDEALRLSRAAGSKRVEAQVLCWLGDAHLHAGEFSCAVDALQLSLTMVRAMGDPIGEAYALYELAIARVRCGELSDAATALAQCLELASTTRSRLAEVKGFTGLSELASARGETDKAIHHLDQALALCRKIHAPLYEVRVLTQLSEAHTIAGDQAAAERALAEALSLAAEMDPVVQSQIRSCKP
ncbi:tetratricopeptide repeat protein [Nonomuraea sp. K274]|uniref:Tetratricopeptide repeat protein n=1 Tax=Nonomuraea cypriaca TaxID=1187855 RepID=A0A931F2Q1_9ACTN|nr:BTAD domain-containing putative transcriptional regulator [Nonomuraea cypriaca]MBF8193189.1 tetratricopeptide repeat protein [Nonomuraea cypriaca]